MRDPRRLCHLVVAGWVALFAAANASAQQPDEPPEQAAQPDETPASAQDGEQQAEPAPSPDPSGSQPAALDDEMARAHFEAARRLYDLASFERAAAEFEEAYRLSGRPELLYNVHVAYRDTGDIPRAVDALRRYLEQVPDAPDRVNLEARLHTLEQQLVDQAELEREREQLAERQRVLRERGSREQATDDDGGGGLLSLAPWIMTSVGGALLVGGTVTGIMALGATSDLEDECPNDLCPSDVSDLEDDRDSASTLATVTDGLLIGGAALVAAGLVWGVLSLESDQEQPQVTAACGPSACGAGVGVRW